MSWLLTLPLLVPVVTAILCYFFRRSRLGAWISVLGSGVGLIAALALFAQIRTLGVAATQIGGWPAPFGITLVADLLSAGLALVTAFLGLCVAIYALAEIDPDLEELGYHSLYQVLIFGVTGAFLTGDLFNLYVWFEVMLIASFGLLILGGRPEQIDGAVKYVTLNLISTTLFLAGIGLLYALTGTLNMADLRAAVAASDRPAAIEAVAMFFLVAFGVKAAVFPVFSWLPASYHTPAHTVSAIFAALLTKVGVYSLFRTFTLIFPGFGGFTETVLLWVAGLTMIVGALGALAQTEARRVLSFQIVSSIGFLLLGLGLNSPLAMAGAILYLIHNMLVKANLFLCAGVIERLAGSTKLARAGGLYNHAPLFSALFLIAAFSLGGFPPLSGFWGKFLLVKAGMDLQAWVITTTVLIAGLLTIFSMMRLWAMMFWTPHPDGTEPGWGDTPEKRAPMLIPIAVLGAASLVIGLVPGPFIAFSQEAAEQLLSPTAYIAEVLPPDPAEISADAPGHDDPREAVE
ncbi:MAG: Na+/H+ antiporter subunit D [Qingshengfaniella sp.]